MNTIQTITEFFGWCSVINIGLLLLASIILIFTRTLAAKIHGKMFELDEQYLSKVYFKFLAQYKLAIIVLNVTPYIALKIIG